MVPVPGAMLPPEVAARLPAIIATMRRLYESRATMVVGIDAGIAPVEQHDVVRYAPTMLCQLGFGPAGALRAITSVAAGVCGLGHSKGRTALGFDAHIQAVDSDPIGDPGALHRVRAVYARGAAVPGAGPDGQPQEPGHQRSGRCGHGYPSRIGVAEGPSGQLGPVCQLQLGQGVPDVPLDGPLGQHQLAGDGPVGQAGRD
jgi:hypothetical protein